MIIAILIFTLLCVFTPDNLDGVERLCPYPTYEEFLSANEDKTHLIWYMNCRMNETMPLNVINEYLATKREENPEKYKNVNSFVKALIEEEIGHRFE